MTRQSSKTSLRTGAKTGTGAGAGADAQALAEWQKTIKAFPEANFLQSPAYGRMNELLGAKVFTEDFGGKGRALMIVREAKRGKYLEIPCGPLIDWNDETLIESAFQIIQEIGRREKCVFVRIRPQLIASEANLEKLTRLGMRKSPMHLAAERTVMIDLSAAEDEMLARMRRQTRYEVRRANKLGIKVTRHNSEACFKEFHQIQADTARRQKFIPPDLATLMAERTAFGDQIDIYIAETVEGEKVAYGLIIKDGREGDYYEAASTPLNRKLPGAYALLWQVMRDLKADGYERFNLWGIAPEGQPSHRYAGVTTFKTGFGGEIVDYVPAHDLVISKVGYLKDRMVETARKKRRHL